MGALRMDTDYLVMKRYDSRVMLTDKLSFGLASEVRQRWDDVLDLYQSYFSTPAYSPPGLGVRKQSKGWLPSSTFFADPSSPLFDIQAKLGYEVFDGLIVEIGGGVQMYQRQYGIEPYGNRTAPVATMGLKIEPLQFWESAKKLFNK